MCVDCFTVSLFYVIDTASGSTGSRDTDVCMIRVLRLASLSDSICFNTGGPGLRDRRGWRASDSQSNDDHDDCFLVLSFNGT